MLQIALITCRSHHFAKLIHAHARTYQMSTSTYALPVKTAILPDSNKHERRRVPMQSLTARSPLGSLRSSGESGTAHSVSGQNDGQSARRTSASNNVLGIEGAMSWESKGVAVGPVPHMKGKRHRGQSDMGRRFPLQTTFPNSPMSPRTPLSAKYALHVSSEVTSNLTNRPDRAHSSTRSSTAYSSHYRFSRPH